MVKLKFIVRDGALVLRISENKQRFYKGVKHLLVGSPNIQKHWIADKEKFSTNSMNYQENNKVLRDFKMSFLKLTIEHPEYTARQIASVYSHTPEKTATKVTEQLQELDHAATFFEPYLEVVMQREKAKQGCNFEIYKKLLAKCRKLIPDFNVLRFSDIDYDKCVYIANIFAKHAGYKSTTKAFRAVLGRAAKDKAVDFNLSRIEGFRFNDYNPGKNDELPSQPDVLSPEETRAFLNLDVFKITPKTRNRKLVELYYDFCVFMLQSFFAPCDVIKLKYKNITKAHTIVARRKKTHKAIEIPITPKMQEIIDKYRGTTSNGYVFPIMDDEKAKGYIIKDYLFKKFRQQLNVWLKYLGEELGLSFNLYAYVFRHTAITVALDNGLPISYIAMAAGTSIEMIQQHYYNGNSASNRNKLQMAFIRAGIQ